MLTALRALPLLWRVVTILGVLGALGGSLAYLRHQIYTEGYTAGYAAASAICEADKRAMEEANRKAISEAEKKLLETERELIEKETKLDDLLKALDLMADEEPDSDLIALPVGSVRRLSAIQ